MKLKSTNILFVDSGLEQVHPFTWIELLCLEEHKKLFSIK